MPSCDLCSDLCSVFHAVAAREKKSLYCIRYAFQAVIYAVWQERNKVRHGDKMLPLPVLKKVIEKGMRNRFYLLRKTKGMEEILQF